MPEIEWEYYQVGEPYELIHIDDHERAEIFEEDHGEWVRSDAWWGEIHFNGRGKRVAESVALAAIAKRSKKKK